MCLGLLALAPGASAQEGFLGRGRYPQFRNVSGLPGGSFGVTPDGHPGIMGALALSTPIGYSLSDFRVVVALANMSEDARPRVFDVSETDQGRVRSNGTAAAMIGFRLGPLGRLTYSKTFLSEELDNVTNLQYQIPLKDSKLGLSLGVQDVFDDGGSAGEADPTDKESSRSPFVVGTYDFGRNVYGSLGVGTRRFRGGFANVSVPLGARGRAMAEYDGFGLNFGAAYSLGRFPRTERVEANLFFGYVRGRNATVGLSVSF
jgi:hypothetical protein